MKHVDSSIVLHAPSLPNEMAPIRLLFSTYAASLKVGLCFTDFANELACLPGEYETPRGALWLATVNGAAVGCCAMRPLDSADYRNACEMKRLYVSPDFRGLGIGRRLADAILESAKQAGYETVLLDTLDEMEAARALYADLGFVEIPPYYYTPTAGAHYLMVHLK